MLNSTMKNCTDSDLILKFKSLNEKLRTENRVSILGLADLCAVSDENKKFVRQILSINSGLTACNQLASSQQSAEEIFREFSKSTDGDLKLLVNKIRKYLKRNDIKNNGNERNNLQVLHILSHTIRHDLVRDSHVFNLNEIPC